MSNKRKLRILNPVEMRPLTGGTGLSSKCNKAGDTIICVPVADVKACLHFEGTCPSQKLSLSRLPNQSLPDVNCDIEKVLSEFYLQAYILLKQHPE